MFPDKRIKSIKSIILGGLVLFFCLSFNLAFAGKTIGHKAMVWHPIAKADILIDKDYFQATQQAIQGAKESIYVAMYIINVAPIPDDNPASLLLESLISAKKRGVYVIGTVSPPQDRGCTFYEKTCIIIYSDFVFVGGK